MTWPTAQPTQQGQRMGVDYDRSNGDLKMKGRRLLADQHADKVEIPNLIQGSIPQSSAFANL